MEKILSVSIAAYNVGITLEDALTPFLQDSVRDFLDVMIIDDGSKDNTAEIARAYEQKYPNTFRLISKENGGWGSTLNTGMRNAKGKYFKQLDGDDYYSPDNLADFLRFLSETDADLIQSPFVSFEDESGAFLRQWELYDEKYDFFPYEKTVNIVDCKGIIPAMHSTAIKTELLTKNNIQILEHCFYTDVEFVLKAFNVCKTVAFYEKPIYWYRLGRTGQSMSQMGVRKHYKDHQKMLMTMLDYYYNEVTENYMKQLIAKRLDGVCGMQYTFYFALECTNIQKKELQEFDRLLLEKAPEFYYRVEGKPVALLRKL
ncbi:MAG: glycosyltransferase family 2 protein, partial [Peptococcaceae bacterium]|nr:glycosyltransferase family 2 protein [Peptococcaceae bacterium]